MIKKLKTLLLVTLCILWSNTAFSYKQVIAIKKHEENPDMLHFFFSDATFSNFSLKEKKFVVGQYGNRSLAEYGYNGKKDWPKNADGSFKKLAAAFDSYSFPHGKIYYFDDLTYAEFNSKDKTLGPVKNVTRKMFGGHMLSEDISYQLVSMNIRRNSNNEEQNDFFYDTGICLTGFKNGGFGGTTVKGLYFSWPLADDGSGYKKIAAIVDNPFNSKEQTFFFKDGTIANAAPPHYTEFRDMTDAKTEWMRPDVNWPMASFDPSRHEIQDIVINEGQDYTKASKIYNNGNMQVPIHIWLRVRDKLTDRYVEIQDNPQHTRSLITLYDYDLGTNGVGAYLSTDGFDDNNTTENFSKTWKASRKRNQFDNVIPGATSSMAVPPLTTDTQASPKSSSDQWSRFTYYVTSTETANEKRLCVRAGSKNNYQFSCVNNPTDYTKIKAIPHPVYTKDNFSKGIPIFGNTFYYDSYAELYRIQPIGFNIRTIKPTGFMSNDNAARDVNAWTLGSWSEGYPVFARDDKRNSRFFVIPFNIGNTTATLGYNKGRNFTFTQNFDSTSIYYGRMKSQNSILNNGIIANGLTILEPLNITHGSLDVFDNFGTKVRLNFSNWHWNSLENVWQ